MNRFIFCIFGLALAASGAGQDTPLQCNIGPITKVYGSAPWLVYSCNDAKSVVLISAPGSAASPFYFIFSPEGSGYHLRGEGTGSKVVTDAALHDLQNLSARDIQALLRETKGAAKSSSR
jgi:hypothetical protein